MKYIVEKYNDYLGKKKMKLQKNQIILMKMIKMKIMKEKRKKMEVLKKMKNRIVIVLIVRKEVQEKKLYLMS